MSRDAKTEIAELGPVLELGCGLLTIFESLIIYFECPPNFEVIVFKCSWENAVLPGAFQNHGLCKILGDTGSIVGDSTIENEIPGELSRENMISSHVKKKMLSSHVKRSPLLWLHNKSRLSKQKTI